MTSHNDLVAPAIVPPEAQEAMWFLGMLVRYRLGGSATGGRLAVLEHQGQRGHGSPLHRHELDDETFFVLDGELRVEVDGQAQAAGPGTVAFLPRRLPHGFVVTSPQVRYLTVHQPAGFDDFVRDVGTPAVSVDVPPEEPPPDPAVLAEIARRHNIEILGPPLTL